MHSRNQESLLKETIAMPNDYREPWQLDPHVPGIFGADGNEVLLAFVAHDTDAEKLLAAMRRSVRCVNALAGISDDDLEYPTGDGLAELVRLHRLKMAIDQRMEHLSRNVRPREA